MVYLKKNRLGERMNGKILKISSNDLYGNVDERQVVVFACFNHIKYMNKYVLFTFLGEYNKKKLYYGSVHVKDDSLIIFSVKNDVINYINTFINEYMQGRINTNEYQIMNISNINKVVLVSYSEMSFDKLSELDALSIKKEEPKEILQEKEKKPVFLYLVLIVLILLLVGITYFYINPEAFQVKYKSLDCTQEKYNDDLMMEYVEKRTVTFDKKDKIDKIEVIDIYTFSDEEEYASFRDNEKQNEYFKIDGSFKYNDDSLELRIIYQDSSIIDSYDEIKGYFEKEGYDCIEGYYYE